LQNKANERCLAPALTPEDENARTAPPDPAVSERRCKTNPMWRQVKQNKDVVPSDARSAEQPGGLIFGRSQ
jgi:hypothetical protein